MLSPRVLYCYALTHKACALHVSVSVLDNQSGVAEAFVCLWKRPYMLQRVNSSTVPKLIGAVLDLLDTDRLPQGAAETGVVSGGMFCCGYRSVASFWCFLHHGPIRNKQLPLAPFYIMEPYPQKYQVASFRRFIP